MNRQRGGTFLGLIIGVVLGLGVALAVAVYVTQVPVPFLNKGLTRSGEQDAAEARKNKDWDPNAPLYGKNPAKQSASGAVGDGKEDKSADPKKDAARPEKIEAQDPPKPEKADKSDRPDKTADKPDKADKSDKDAAKGKDAKPVEAKPSADPLGDLAKAKSGSVDPFDYFVQVGAYRTSEDAEGQKAKLAMMGWEARVTEREQSGRTVFRVRVGPFGKRDDAERIKEKLDGAGIDTTMVRVQR